MLKKQQWTAVITGILLLTCTLSCFAVPIAVPTVKPQSSNIATITKTNPPRVQDLNSYDTSITPRGSALPPGRVQREFIKLFQSKIVVHRDATISVTEAITINNRGRRLDQGIYREFPTKYIADNGERKNLRFQLTSTRLNGVPVPYRIENRSNSKRIYIGKKHQRLKPGIYTYTLTYKASHHLTLLHHHEQLAWNVTGSWRFPIKEVTVSIKLPGGAAEHLEKLAAYTGLSGLSKKNIGSFSKHDGVIQFHSTKTLAPHDSLILNLEWKKGFILSPTKFTLGNYLFQKHLGLTSAGIGLLLILIYYYVIWRWVGELSNQKVITAQFTPPHEYSPALLRFIKNMGYNNRVFISALINMAVKGYINITKGIRNYKLIQNTQDRSTLTRPEREIANHLFSEQRKEIAIHRDNRKRFQKTIHAFKRTLRNEIEEAYFVRNTGYFVLGVILSILTIVPAIIIHKSLLYVVIPYTILLVAGLLFYYRSDRSWQSCLSFGGVVTLLIVIMTPYKTTLLPILNDYIGYWIVIGLVTIANGWFYHALKRPTLKGRELLDQTEGFKRFLSASEQSSQPFQDLPERNAVLFERYFPYAIALNVEKEWSNQFVSILNKENDYCPSWYRGSSFENLDASGYGISFINEFSKDFAKAASTVTRTD